MFSVVYVLMYACMYEAAAGHHHVTGTLRQATSNIEFGRFRKARKEEASRGYQREYKVIP